jgi:hypothetical protein
MTMRTTTAAAAAAAAEALYAQPELKMELGLLRFVPF